MVSLLLPLIYLSFISLGLPDGLLGAAWPSMYPMFGVEVSASGIAFMIVSLGTVVSSLLSDRMTTRFGTARITTVSVALTAAALFGFSISGSFPLLCLWAIPYGLGAGGVDASLNNYVALHYESKHMSWLHCMWGVGATVGPYIMGAVLSGGGIWNTGYRIVGIIQLTLVAVLVLSQGIWQKGQTSGGEVPHKALSLKEVFSIPGAMEIMIAFFGYCALEQTAGLWSASYLVLNRGIEAETAAAFASMFFLGITVGRFLNGFIAMKLSDSTMVYLGFGVIGLGIAMLLLPLGNACALAGLVIVGFGCAPIYPCIIHSTPAHFGAENSQALVGVQMASAYMGNILMPPLFGVLANHVSIRLFPWYMLAILLLMAVMYRKMEKKTER
jgi:fucose permease